MADGLRKVIVGVPMTVLLILALFAATPFMATCGGHDDLVTATLRACPRAVALLGDDAHPARLGLACGSSKSRGGAGAASWTLPYTGARARGTVSYAAEKHDDVWQLMSAMLEVGDESIDLIACSTAASGQRPSPGLVQTNADGASGTFEGKVIRSNHPTILVGSSCSGQFKRERGATTAIASVGCTPGVGESGGPPASAMGPTALYVGEPRFSMDVGNPSRRDDDRSELEDPKTTDQDSTPGFRLSSAGGSGTLTIWDTGPPAFELVVEL